MISFFKRGGGEGDGVGGFFRSFGCIADVEGVFGDLESALAVGVEEDVSGFWPFCQKIFGCASSEGSRTGVVEGDGTGEMSAVDIGGMEIALMA